MKFRNSIKVLSGIYDQYLSQTEYEVSIKRTGCFFCGEDHYSRDCKSKTLGPFFAVLRDTFHTWDTEEY